MANNFDALPPIKVVGVVRRFQRRQPHDLRRLPAAVRALNTDMQALSHCQARSKCASRPADEGPRRGSEPLRGAPAAESRARADRGGAAGR